MSLYLKTVARILRSAAGWMLRSRLEICPPETQKIDTQYKSSGSFQTALIPLAFLYTSFATTVIGALGCTTVHEFATPT
jgi:hypothetical protein